MRNSKVYKQAFFIFILKLEGLSKKSVLKNLVFLKKIFAPLVGHHFRGSGVLGAQTGFNIKERFFSVLKSPFKFKKA